MSFLEIFLRSALPEGDRAAEEIRSVSASALTRGATIAFARQTGRAVALLYGTSAPYIISRRGVSSPADW